jgi:hypothetical protein
MEGRMTADFQLDDLYNICAELPLPGDDVAYVRVLTEPEVQQRDEAAMEAYRVREDELRDEEGDEYKRVIEPLDEAEEDTLVAIILSIEAVRFNLEAIRQHPFRFMPYPDEATPQERADVMRKQDEHEAAVRGTRSRVTNEKIETYRGKLQERDEEKLRRQAINALITAQADTERQKEFQIQTVHLSTRKDSTKGPPYWDLETVRMHGMGGLGEQVYNTVLSTYFQLDNLDPWELQKKR